MRRLITFLLVLNCLVLNILSQERYSANVAIGVKGGTTLSQTMFAPGVQQKMIPGMLCGVAVRYIEENHFGVIGELNFMQRGWKEVFEETPYSFSRRLSYIQIPLLAHIYFGNERARFFFNAGPEVGFLLTDKPKANFNYADLSSVPDFPITNRNTAQFTMDIKNKIDYGISAGLGLEVSVNRKNSLLLEGRFYYGLNNLFSANKKDIFSASNGISIMVSLGYMFHIK